MSYWQDRLASSQNKLSEKSIKQVERQLKSYYGTSLQHVLDSFEATYNKLLATVEEGREPTPADLYKLDKYWQLQGQLRQELEKLGDRQISALSKVFELNFFDIYYSINIEGAQAFTTLDTSMVQQMINAIWCADGKNWSQRIWDNMSKLQQTLNDGLIEIVATGKKSTDLKNVLQERFGVSYSRADALVRTEVAHIQTEAAKKRYEDYGIQKVQFWADPDERTCDVCGKLHEKIYMAGEAVPIPAHPRCRCCVMPVIE